MGPKISVCTRGSSEEMSLMTVGVMNSSDSLPVPPKTIFPLVQAGNDMMQFQWTALTILPTLTISTLPL